MPTTEHFDIVILDGPPVMGLADAPLIASVAYGAVLTIEAGRTSRAQARAAIKRLRLGNARIFGADPDQVRQPMRGPGSRRVDRRSCRSLCGMGLRLPTARQRPHPVGAARA